MKYKGRENSERERERERKKEMEGSDNAYSVYRECLRNHAASLGSYATDGCGEFTLDDSSPGSFQCAACGCHRNFHRKVTCPPTTNINSHHPHHDRALLSCSSRGRGGDTDMVEYVDGGGGGGDHGRPPSGMVEAGSDQLGERMMLGKKRFRTKFTQEQKEKMLAFAEKLGWKLQRKDLEDEIDKFCRGVGVSRQVFKVWMHNHKNSSSSSSASTGNASSLTQQ